MASATWRKPRWWRPISPEAIGVAGNWAVTDYPGYLVSRVGNVFNERTGKILSSWLMTNGYWAVAIKVDERKTVYVHRLLASAFIARVDGKSCVNHINGVKSDNSLENLEWCTHAENMTHARDTGLSASHLVANPQMIAATRKKVQQVCLTSGRVIAEFVGLNAAMRDTGLGSIRRCVNGLQANTGGFAWRYAPMEGRS